jgi:hypothetical protein
MRRTTPPLAHPVFALAAIALAGGTVTPGRGAARTAPDQRGRTMKIRINVEGTTTSGALENNATAGDSTSPPPADRDVG